MIKRRILEYVTSDKRITLRKTISRESGNVDLTIVIPIHNQRERVLLNLESILENATSKYELILIDDNSKDGTSKLLNQYLQESLLQKYSNCISIKYFTTSIPVYETKCDEFGIKRSMTEYVIEIQADMNVREKGFDSKLLALIKSNPKMLGISGRATHTFEELSFELLEKQTREKFDITGIIRAFVTQKRMILGRYRQRNLGQTDSRDMSYKVEDIFPDEYRFSQTGVAGWVGKTIDCIPSESDIYHAEIYLPYRERIWNGDTIIRGPMILRKSSYQMLEGFNTKSFFLGNDDHDLCLRAKVSGLVVGFTPMHFVAPLIHGTERSQKNLMNLTWRELHRCIRSKNLKRTPLFQHVSGLTGIIEKHLS